MSLFVQICPGDGYYTVFALDALGEIWGLLDGVWYKIIERESNGTE